MVFFVRSLVVFAAVVATAAFSPAQSLEIGEYFRPASDEVSGIPGTDAPYRRSPCPALNSLANHGVLPRNGQNVTKAVLREAITGVYMFADDAVKTLLNAVPEVFSLDFFGTHNMLEHDASLVHKDLYFGQDPMLVDTELVVDLFSHVDENGNFGVKEFAAVRKARLINSMTLNPEVVFGATQQALAYPESAILLLGFGAKNNETISADVVRSFVVEERIPEGWKGASTPITVAEVRATVAKIIASTV